MNTRKVLAQPIFVALMTEHMVIAMSMKPALLFSAKQKRYTVININAEPETTLKTPIVDHKRSTERSDARFGILGS